jgi:diguanylate cyclase (GGDEF)-like protein
MARATVQPPRSATDNYGMGGKTAPTARFQTSRGNHFSCSVSAVLLAEVSELSGADAVPAVLRLAGSQRSAGYLTDTRNWISYDEAVALWRAASTVTHNPTLVTLAGRRAAQRLGSSPVAQLLRSLGSPENLYREIATSATKFSTVVRLEATELAPGFAEVVATPVSGFPRAPEHCAWTTGMLSGSTTLFGLPPAEVQHDRCAALGAAECLYRVSWSTGERTPDADPDPALLELRQQLDATQEQLQSLFATASDLIAADDIGEVLGRITDRVAVEVRAPRYLLAVRMEPGGEVHCHHRGFDKLEVAERAEQILGSAASELPSSWLVVPVRSDRREYGKLLAAFETDGHFFPQEHELLEVYARYAASALDGASALLEAKRRYDQSRALLRLARALATAGTSAEIAQRLADAVPLVVDCDRVGVWLWESARGELVRRAIANRDPDDLRSTAECRRLPSREDPLERLLSDPRQDPIFVDADNGPALLRRDMMAAGEAASIHVPLSTDEALLGILTVSVRSGPGRLRPNSDLLNRLSGIAAQATTALQNGRLVDRITHQALHDQLTGLANRARFAELLRTAVNHARQRGEAVTIFYIDLDDFKPVNDAYGHEIGDRMLAAVGNRLRAATRSVDLVARLGGDEFVVLLSSPASPADANSVLTRLEAAFEDPITIDGHQLRLTASIGQAVFPDDATSADGLLRHADASMFKAKRGFVSPR